ncbi:MAG TPA: NAD(P)H-quinone oxidoreductase, partial [Longimicrobiales bacterium]|nr:NAD(P)H-quinone oxidoreductase [Longimicrobiales bacterium]
CIRGGPRRLPTTRSPLRAIVIAAPGGPEVLEERELPSPEPGRGEVLVRVRATALNRADLLQRRGRYAPPPGVPSDIPGLEYAGVVERVGEDVRHRRPGERVMGLVAGGAYAEYVRVHARETVPVPTGLALEEAAAVPEAFITAWDALFPRLGLGMGERLLIHAVGSGVGTAAVQLARHAGALTLGTARSAWKLTRAAELGLDVGIDSSHEDFSEVVSEKTGGDGVDAILDLVGAEYLEANLRSLALGGRQVVVGTVSGTRAEVDLSMLLRRRITLVGTVLRSRPLEEKIEAALALERHVSPLLADRRIRPVVDRVLPIEEVHAAHRAMEENENFGKIVLTW